MKKKKSESLFLDTNMVRSLVVRTLGKDFDSAISNLTLEDLPSQTLEGLYIKDNQLDIS